jgi:uncharacterized protein YktA (UPF0223 family)
VSVDRGHYESAVSFSHVIGNNVTLPCIVNNRSNVKWLNIDFHKAQQFKVYGEGQVKNKYKGKISVDTDCATGNCSLILINAQTTDSGWYVCVSERNHQVTSKRVITLIVASEY